MIRKQDGSCRRGQADPGPPQDSESDRHDLCGFGETGPAICNPRSINSSRSFSQSLLNARLRKQAGSNQYSAFLHCAAVAQTFFPGMIDPVAAISRQINLVFGDAGLTAVGCAGTVLGLAICTEALGIGGADVVSVIAGDNIAERATNRLTKNSLCRGARETPPQ